MNSPIIRRRPLLAEPLADLHPVVARVLAARDVRTPADIDPSLGQLLPPTDMAGVEAAAERLARAVSSGERILVVGDFDADGATSTAFAVRALRLLGHPSVDYLVPNRFDYGYGLSPELVEAARARAPSLILTVDNGISSHHGVAAAREAGIDVVVTDHHLPPPELPPAAAVVNPNRADCGFASKNLAGVGVIFYVMAVTRTRLQNDPAWPGELPSLANLLDLVALGTVADVVPLDRNNRILVEQGLKRVRAGQGSPGVEALLRSGKRDPRQATAQDLAYCAAPRLNAAGRMADMGVGIETLLADEPASARRHTAALDDLNRNRRHVEAEMKAQADAEVERLRGELDTAEQLPSIVVLHDDRWHQGVSGILAGRVRQAIHRPVIILADNGDGQVRGSCRSIPGLHIRDVLAAVDARHPGLMTGFGGHAMAAGLGLPRDAIEPFREAVTAQVTRALGGLPATREILTDGPLAPDEMTLETAEALRSAAPWGAEFPAPTFDGDFLVREHRVVGEHHVKLQVEPVDAPDWGLEAMAFHADSALHVRAGTHIRMVYRLEVNEFRGRRGVQLVIEHLEPH